MDNMKETILRDGEVAILIGGAEVIMNENTLLSLLEKFGLIEKVKDTQPAVPSDPEGKMLQVILGKFNLPVGQKPKSAPVYPIAKQTNIPADGTIVTGRTRPVIAFVYDKAKVDKTGNRYDGFVARYKYFESAQEAEEYFDMAKGRVSAIARTWGIILGKTWKVNNPVATKNDWCGTDYWGTPYNFTANTNHGTMAFIYLDEIPHSGPRKTFVV